jgi:hypothetical protein
VGTQCLAAHPAKVAADAGPELHWIREAEVILAIDLADEEWNGESPEDRQALDPIRDLIGPVLHGMGEWALARCGGVFVHCVCLLVEKEWAAPVVDAALVVGFYYPGGSLLEGDVIVIMIIRRWALITLLRGATSATTFLLVRGYPSVFVFPE